MALMHPQRYLLMRSIYYFLFCFKQVGTILILAFISNNVCKVVTIKIFCWVAPCKDILQRLLLSSVRCRCNDYDEIWVPCWYHAKSTDLVELDQDQLRGWHGDHRIVLMVVLRRHNEARSSMSLLDNKAIDRLVCIVL